jgi:aryl-alcohol dehydrogenase-like predicted oxidoreductase
VKYVKLGVSGLEVSRVCLGTMPMGGQHNAQDSERVLDCAIDLGINFFDTAEMYPIPIKADTCANTERVIGDWLTKHSRLRPEIIIASKIVGRGIKHIRGGAKPDGASIVQAVDDSLVRLQTDYIDLFQIHWPSRAVPHFAKHWPGEINVERIDATHQSEDMLGLLRGLDKCVKAGKIRFCGLSNETPWGVNEYLRLAKLYDLPVMTSVQNEFSLLHTIDWPYMMETCSLNNVAYLPWSPLAGGALSGKYMGGARPMGSRWMASQRLGLFRDTPRGDAAIAAYVAVAERYDLTAAQLALAWVDQVDGVSSIILGATSEKQLRENIDAFNMPLSSECIVDIAGVLKNHPLTF